MAVHVIIGKGNLGLDLQDVLDTRKNTVHLWTRSEGFKWPEDVDKLRALKPDCVWITAGGGSVEHANTYAGLREIIDTHVYLPMSISQGIEDSTRLVVFSSDYVVDEGCTQNPARQVRKPRSRYAYSKAWMEQGLTGFKRPWTSIVRVGSLYGMHYPERCLPGKIIMRNPTPTTLSLPCNFITPTPTDWIANKLVQHYDSGLFSKDGVLVHHCAPLGQVSVQGFGQRILGQGNGYNVESKGWDDARPHYSNMGCSLGKPGSWWHDLWEERAPSFRDALASPR